MSKKQKKVVQWNDSQALTIARTTENADYLQRLANHESLLVRRAVLNNKHTPLETIKEMRNDSDSFIASRANSILFQRKH